MSNIIQALSDQENAKKLKATINMCFGYLSNEQVRLLSEALAYKSSTSIYEAVTDMLPAEDRRPGMIVQHTLQQLELNSLSPQTAAIVLAGAEKVCADNKCDDELVASILGNEAGYEWDSGVVINTMAGGLLGGQIGTALKFMAPKLLKRTWWGMALSLVLSVTGGGAGFFASQPKRDPDRPTLNAR